LLMGCSTYTRYFTAANVNPMEESMPEVKCNEGTH
jgi:hypothetical protein